MPSCLLIAFAFARNGSSAAKGVIAPSCQPLEPLLESDQKRAAQLVQRYGTLVGVLRQVVGAQLAQNLSRLCRATT